MTGPYRELHVYEVEGTLSEFPTAWKELGFLGCWHEGEYSFLFFSSPQGERVEANPRRVLDHGTGSGVLALAAARLGAERVLGVDPQPIAVEMAKANVRRNGLPTVVEVRLCDAVEVLGEPADLVLANLT